MRTRLGLISGLLMIAVLGIPSGAQAATRSARSTPSISPTTCTHGFFLYAYRNGAAGYIGAGGDLHFDLSHGPGAFCQVAITAGSKKVVIFDEDENGKCLALNATTDAIDLDSASVCEKATVTYLQWTFIVISGVKSFGNKAYAL